MHTQPGLSLMKKPRIWLASVLILSGLLGCSNKPETPEAAAKQDAAEKTEKFASAINSYLSKKNDLCLGLHHWPVKVSEADLQLTDVFPDGVAGQMAALERAGVVSASETQTRALASSDLGNIKAKKYQLTDFGKKFLVETEIESVSSFDDNKKLIKSDICYGKKVLDQVIKQKKPIGSGSNQDDEQQTVVRYMYKIDNLAEWVKNPDIKTAFPSIEQRFKESSQTYTVALKLTSSGWAPIE